jgi:hypothetical protein
MLIKVVVNYYQALPKMGVMEQMAMLFLDLLLKKYTLNTI